MTLKIENLSKRYTTRDGQVAALDNISLTIDSKEFVAVMGPSGCGKTTLLLTAGGLQAPDAGTAVVAGEDLYALPAETRARHRARRIGFVFQQFHLVPYLDVLDNVLARSQKNYITLRTGVAPKMEWSSEQKRWHGNWCHHQGRRGPPGPPPP